MRSLRFSKFSTQYVYTIPYIYWFSMKYPPNTSIRYSRVITNEDLIERKKFKFKKDFYLSKKYEWPPQISFKVSVSIHDLVCISHYDWCLLFKCKRLFMKSKKSTCQIFICIDNYFNLHFCPSFRPPNHITFFLSHIRITKCHK